MNYHHLTIEERSRSAGKAHTGHRNRGATRPPPGGGGRIATGASALAMTGEGRGEILRCAQDDRVLGHSEEQGDEESRRVDRRSFAALRMTVLRGCGEADRRGRRSLHGNGLPRAQAPSQ